MIYDLDAGRTAQTGDNKPQKFMVMTALGIGLGGFALPAGHSRLKAIIETYNRSRHGHCYIYPTDSIPPLPTDHYPGEKTYIIRVDGEIVGQTVMGEGTKQALDTHFSELGALFTESP